MKWTLRQGEQVKYRPATDQPEQWGYLRKEVHILNERSELVSVYVVTPQDGSADLLLGDGEIVEQRPAHASANKQAVIDSIVRYSAGRNIHGDSRAIAARA
jgi:hypothetical protein